MKIIINPVLLIPVFARRAPKSEERAFGNIDVKHGRRLTISRRPFQSRRLDRSIATFTTAEPVRSAAI
ncbi:hypothetical protein [Rhodoblastus sp.]|uniref:hypothetical protein n=1 Tax=Rhodoblastus sp. TaxID=1962975 RepID=UPI003F9E2C8B